MSRTKQRGKKIKGFKAPRKQHEFAGKTKAEWTKIKQTVYKTTDISIEKRIQHHVSNGFQHQIEPKDPLFSILSNFSTATLGDLKEDEQDELRTQLNELNHVLFRAPSENDSLTPVDRENRVEAEKALFKEILYSLSPGQVSLPMSRNSCQRGEYVRSLFLSYQQTQPSPSTSSTEAALGGETNKMSNDVLFSKINALIHVTDEEWYDLLYDEVEDLLDLIKVRVKEQALLGEKGDAPLIKLLLAVISFCDAMLTDAKGLRGRVTTDQFLAWDQLNRQQRHFFFQWAAIEYGFISVVREQGIPENLVNVAQFCLDCRAHFGFGVPITGSMARQFAGAPEWVRVIENTAKKYSSVQRKQINKESQQSRKSQGKGGNKRMKDQQNEEKSEELMADHLLTEVEKGVESEGVEASSIIR